MSWFDSKICHCEHFHYTKDFDWEKEFAAMKYPPICGKCGKWMDRVKTCGRCGHDYYQFFWHPLMGWEPSLAARGGWECWNCLEDFCRHVTRKVPCTKTPPPAVVLPPGYMLFKEVDYFAGI